MNFTDVLGTWKQIKAYIDTKISSSGADSLPVGTLLTSVNNSNVFGDNFKLCDGKIYALNVEGLENVKLLDSSDIDFSKASLCAKYSVSSTPSTSSIYMLGDKLYIGVYSEGIICFDFKTEKFQKLFDSKYGNNLDIFYGDRIISVDSLRNTSPYYWEIKVTKINGESISYKITNISVWYTLLYVAWFHGKYILFEETNSECHIYTTTDFLNFEEIYLSSGKTYFCYRMIDDDHLFFKDNSNESLICLINKDFSIKKYTAYTSAYMKFHCIYNNYLVYSPSTAKYFYMLDLNTGDIIKSGEFARGSIVGDSQYYNIFDIIMSGTKYVLVSNFVGSANTTSVKDLFNLCANAIYPYGDYIYNLQLGTTADFNIYMYKMHKNSLYLPSIKNTFCKIK